MGEAGGQGAQAELEERACAVTPTSPHVSQLEDAAREAGGEDQAGGEAALHHVALEGQIRLTLMDIQDLHQGSRGGQ